MRAGRSLAMFALLMSWSFGAFTRGEDGPDQGGAVFDFPARGDGTLGSFATTHRILKVDPAGVADIELRPEFRKLFGVPSIVEGYYLMVVGTEGRGSDPRLFRAQVLDVTAKGHARMALGPKAIARVRPGEPFLLIRPEGSTTAQFQSLPPEIPVRIEPVAPVMPRSDPTGQAAARETSLKNLKRIDLAFRSFHESCDAFPPAVVYGPDGKPWHSWRVLILPFLEEQALYSAYDFRQPWDSETNLKILDRMPSVYRDPIYGEKTGHFTHYSAPFGVVGRGVGAVHSVLAPPGHRMKDTRWSSVLTAGPDTVRLRDVVDGPASTILLASVSPDRKIPWTKPEDIPFEVGGQPGLGRPVGLTFPYRDETRPGTDRVAPILMTDGGIKLLSVKVNPATLHALITRDGREKINPSAILREPASPPPPAHQVTVLRVRFAGDGSRASILNVTREASIPSVGR